MMTLECHKCRRTEEEVRLRKCPICFKHYCDDDATLTSGVMFCSKGCGEYFFHAEPDD